MAVTIPTIPLAAQETVDITVVATSDVHGHVMHWDYVNDREAPWGLTRAATVIDSLRRAVNGNLVLVDAGDALQGNAFATFYSTQRELPIHPGIDVLGALEYDAFTPGDHEFDFGMDVFDRAIDAAQVPVVSANIYQPNPLGRKFNESTIFDRGGVKVGVTGFTTPGVMVWNKTRLARGWRVRSILPEARRALRQMQTDGVELKIALLHSGFEGPSSYDPTGVGEEHAAARLAELGVKPDLVIVGHSHQPMGDRKLAGVHFMQPAPYAQGLSVAKVRLARGGDGKFRVRQIVSEHISLENALPDAALTQRLETVHSDARAWVNEPIATSRSEWSARLARAEDTPLYDFVNDVQQRTTGADLSATPVFNTTALIPVGDVRLRHLRGLYPYEYTLKVVQIDGATLRAYLERTAEYFLPYRTGAPLVNPRMAGENFDVVSGVDYAIDLSQPVGSRIAQLEFRGHTVQPGDVFTMAINSHRQAGGGGFEMLARLPVVHDHGGTIRQLLIDEVRRAQRLDSEMYFRPSWQIVPEAAAVAAKREFMRPLAAGEDRTLLRVLVTSDLFGSLTPHVPALSDGRAVGGVAALGGWLDSLSSTCDCSVLRLDAGDALRGSFAADPSYGKLMVKALNALRYDAMVVGPREVEWGLDTLRARGREAEFTLIASNVSRVVDGAAPNWAAPWALLERDGFRIGVVGVSDGTVPAVVRSSPGNFNYDDAVSAVEYAVSGFWDSKVDFVVVAAHLEAWCESSGCTGPLMEFAHRLDPGSVHLIVGGHGNGEAITSANGIPIVIPGAYGRSVGVADLVSLGRGGFDVRTSLETAWADTFDSDSMLSPLVTSWNQGADEVVGTMKFIVPYVRLGESSLGRFVADAYRNAGRAEIGVVHNAAMRAGLPAGGVTRRNIYDILPRQHRVLRATVSGKDIYEMLEHILSDDAPMAHVSGIRVWYNPRARKGKRVRRVRFHDDQPVRKGEAYTLAFNEHLAAGGDGFHMLRGLDVEDVQQTGMEALIAYFERLGETEQEAPDDPRFVR